MKRSTLLLVGLCAYFAVFFASCGDQGQPRTHTKYGVSPHASGFGRPAPQSAQHNFSAGRTVSMYDTITLDTVPSNPQVLAGYTSGYWPTYQPLVNRYPKAKVKSIAIAARYHAMCLDVEPGDATPDQVVAWFYADRKAGFSKPCIYSSYYYWRDQISPLLAKAHIPRSAYWAWDADYTYYAHIDYGFDGTQWTDHYNNKNLDASTITYAFSELIAPKPQPKPAPKPKPVNHHYAYFSTSTFEGINELDTVKAYDRARLHPKKNAKQLKSLERKLSYLGGRVYYVSNHPQVHGKPSWSKYHRGFRFQQLEARAHGKQI